MQTKTITSHSITSTTGQYFCFEIITNDGVIDIRLSGLEWQIVKKDELRELARFILKYLENN